MGMRSFARLRGFALCAALATTAAGWTGAAPPGELPPAKAEQLLARLPLRFEPTQGQHSAGVRFSARNGQMNLDLSARRARLRFPGQAPASLDISWPGSNWSPGIVGADPAASKSSYFLGNRKERWRTGVPHYKGVRYQGLYPGIDLLFYGAGSDFEYDFHLRPGADPGRIRIRFRGADQLSLSPEGNLEIQAGGNRLVQKRPVAYQPTREPAGYRTVECGYRRLGRDVVGLELAEYDRSLPLVIDPVLVYASFLGSGAEDVIVSVKVDAAGMVYVAGYTTSSGFAVSEKAIQAAIGGDRDVFVAKLNPAAAGADSLAYFTYFGGSGSDTPTGMTLDAGGNVYLTGYTASQDFPVGGTGPQSKPGGSTGEDAFVVVLSPGLEDPLYLCYGTYLGGSASDIPYGIDIDAAGAIYVAGVTKSSDFPLAGSPVQNALWGIQDGFVAKLDFSLGGSNALVYSSYLGGDGIELCRSIAVTPSGMIYVTGEKYTGDYFPITDSAFQPNYRGNGDIFVTQLDLTRPGYDAIVYSTFLGGSGPDEVRRIVLAPDGGVLLTGYTLSRDFPVTPNAFQRTPGGSGDAFLAKLDPSGRGAASLVYSTYLGGSATDVAYDLATDPQGNVYLTGYTLSPNFPVTPDALRQVASGGVDIFCTRLDLAAPPARSLVYSTLAGGGGIDVAYSLAVSSGGVIYLAGYAQDRALPVTGNALQGTHAGGLADGFILVLAPR